MKRFTLCMAGLLLALSAFGCDDELVSVTIRNPYDLKVQVWDVHTNGAYAGAYVLVNETRDSDHTNADGWTDPMQTPANAQRVTVSVSWYTEDGFPQSRAQEVYLQHQVVTTATVYVDTRPLH